MKKPEKKTDESYLSSTNMTQQGKDLLEHWDNGYNQACDEWEEFIPTEGEIESIIIAELTRARMTATSVSNKNIAKAIHKRIKGE